MVDLEKLRKLLLSIALILALGLGATYLSFRYHLHAYEQERIRVYSQRVQSAEQALDRQLKQFEFWADTLSYILTTKRSDSAYVLNWMDSLIHQKDNVYGIGFAAEAYEFTPHQELFGPFFIQPDKQVQLTWVDTAYDYRESKWYSQPLKEGKSWFEPPYFGVVSQTLMAEYSIPFQRSTKPGADTIGIAYIDISLEGINSILKQIELGNSGYPLLLSRTGNYISHPIAEWVKNEENIHSKAKELDAPST